MKLTLFQILALTVVANVAAQNAEDRNKIKSVQDAKSVELLNDKIAKRDGERKQKVSLYLSQHPEKQIEYTVNNRNFRMIDVVDNKPLYIATDNSSEAMAIRTNRINPGGALGLSLDGSGMTAGIWDGGRVLQTHVEFVSNGVSRITPVDGSGTGEGTNFHATHVGGTIAATGLVRNAKGMAPAALLRSYDWGADLAEMTVEARDNAMLISNHSYGVPIFGDDNTMQVPNWYPGCYNDDSALLDQFAFTYEYYLMVKSAGNEGVSNYTGGLGAGLDKLTSEAASKNNIVIANADATVHPVTGVTTSLMINVSSSQGPTDDGRIKPDVAADGTSVYSTYNTNDSAYENLSGTSMAAPGITGSALLLQQHYANLHPNDAIRYMRSATLRGLICHSATDANSTPGPDFRFGYGMMNSEAAVNIITNANNQNLLLESSLQNNTTYTYNFSVTSAGTVTATLCWTDPAGTSREGLLNSPLAALVNDLDLRITRNGTTYYPWKYSLSDLSGGAITGDNIVDNLEKIEIFNAEPGDYTLTVSHKGSLRNVNGAQKYSLILSGSNNLALSADKNVLGNVTVWPNPAKDVLNVNFGQQLSNVQLALVDMSGRIVYQSKSGSVSGQEFSINTSNFSKGIYMLNISSDNKTMTKKIIVE
ncbi:S8 family serine peptidase [Flavobacterium sp. Sd200]|uniref:S8 family serine peptidase n=1 Tax=Flavobacterium sp. Sd200 TaxID=2692211 RepID=UPI001368D167|nr:S8 family serine peptidase [Flavobacterium sp. Sd200]MXN91902.1 S8 family serine peptidase [Flavobacterium sp. Sd200]